MLVPKFELNQDDSRVFITITASYANIADTEVYVDETDFIFCSKPYYLRLKLPGEVLDTDESCAVYDATAGIYNITVYKAVPGQEFKNLNLISTLLAKRTKEFLPGKSITVLGDAGGNTCEVENETESELETTLVPKYGFGCHYSEVFKGFTYEVYEIFDLADPDSTSSDSRTGLRKNREREDFNTDHYLADFFDCEVMEEAMKFVPAWESNVAQFKVPMDMEEFDRIKNILQHVWVKEKAEFISLGLVDILLAYCYDHRTTGGDSTSESAWTINKLSSTLCYCEEFKEMKEVLVAFLTRSICYPLYRNWELSMRVLKDVQKLLRCGKLYLQKCLLHIHKLFNASEPRYLLNRIYIDDYCLWIANVEDEELEELAERIAKTVLVKEDVGLELSEIELAAKMVIEEEAQDKKLVTDMTRLSVTAEESDCDDSSSSSSNSSSSSSEEDNCSSEEELDSDDVSE